MARIGVCEEDAGDARLVSKLGHVDIVVQRVLRVGVVARTRPLPRGLVIASACRFEEIEMDLLPLGWDGAHDGGCARKVGLVSNLGSPLLLYLKSLFLPDFLQQPHF
jgi:hypothetical protein